MNYKVKKVVAQLERKGRFAQEKFSMQHGNTTVYMHSVNVAQASLKLAKMLNLKVNERALIRGALLHDYFLYDWHVSDPDRAPHPTNHPRVACKNAIEDYKIGEIEQNIILSHMFPLPVALPRYKESWLVTIADKACTINETIYPRAFLIDRKTFIVRDVLSRVLRVI